MIKQEDMYKTARIVVFIVVHKLSLFLFRFSHFDEKRGNRRVCVPPWRHVCPGTARAFSSLEQDLFWNSCSIELFCEITRRSYWSAWKRCTFQGIPRSWRCAWLAVDTALPGMHFQVLLCASCFTSELLEKSPNTCSCSANRLS